MNCKRGTIKLISPEVCTDILDRTRISLCVTEDIGPLTVKCVKLTKDRSDYIDSVVCILNPDSDGNASFVFFADEYPHGPIEIRIYGGNNEKRDVLHLQYFNVSGYKENTPKALPCKTKDFELVYEDDFTDRNLLISDRESSGYKYYSHKPGGGDFSQIPFTDFNSEKNPFSQKETYLRIQADMKKHSSGLLSNVFPDGSGVTVKAPCYFECRFIAPNTIGTWPAFWLMNQSTHKGLHEPTDELDTIEAYGLEDLDHQNQIGYYVTSHKWNQGKKETTDPDKFIDMREISNGLTWDMCPHTYGTLITETETTYFCDNVEVFSHPTQPVSAKEPFFFMINLAVGGNGWPVDISRYGKADMWVDFVRVFKGKQ